MPSDAHRLLPDHPYSSYQAYLAAVGASAVESARRMAPETIIASLRRSGLRGRGGAGFPTGNKWNTIFQHPAKRRDVVVNAAEGEPGTFKDRALLRSNPYSMIEGLLIAAHTVGARAAYVATKGSFTREIERVKQALAEMKELIGRLPITVVEGPEEYLFGEEKALLNVIEGEEPLPRVPESPPYEVGLFATPGSPNPALVNNVQTLAHVSTIIRHGADSFRKLGTADTPGTLLFTLSGDLMRPGVYEVEAGISVRTLLEDQGGGARPGRHIRLALPGVSAAPIHDDQFDTHCDFGSLARIGSSLASAGFIAVDDATSIPRVTQSVARFLYVESCNQCSACKAGLRIASRAIDEIFDVDKATADDPERASFGARSAPQGNRCYLPVQGSILIPHLLKRHAEEFAAQVAAPQSAPTDWVIPKMVDYDQSTHRFSYDEKQPRKRPDWTWEEAAAGPTRPSRQSVPPSVGSIAVRLAPDLFERLHALADAGGIDLDRQVETALREWLKSQPGT